MTDREQKKELEQAINELENIRYSGNEMGREEYIRETDLSYDYKKSFKKTDRLNRSINQSILSVIDIIRKYQKVLQQKEQQTPHTPGL